MGKLLLFLAEYTAGDILIRLLRENELSEADHIFRPAFGTFLALSFELLNVEKNYNLDH
jgi:hypothetical protein